MKISIIIPIYKVEQYLDECIQSVLKQTYRDLEIILVDDGSPDRCPIICNEYAQKDSRIQVIHRDNGGLSAARNSGLAIATGEYVYFLDSDDKIFPSSIEAMVERINEFPGVDIVVASALNQDNSPLHYYDYPSYPRYSENVDWIRDKFCNWEVGLTAWNKLFKMDYVKANKLSFPEGLIHEDIFWSFYVQKCVRSIAFVEQYCYWYRWSNKASITNEIDKTKSCLAHLQIIELLERDIEDKLEVKFLMPISSFEFWSAYYPLSKNRKRIKDKCSEIHINIKKRNPSSLFLKEFSVINAPKWMISNSFFYIFRAYKKILRTFKVKC